VMIDSGRRGTTHSWDLSGRGAMRAEDAQGIPTQSHISPSILVHVASNAELYLVQVLVASGSGVWRFRGCGSVAVCSGLHLGD